MLVFRPILRAAATLMRQGTWCIELCSGVAAIAWASLVTATTPNSLPMRVSSHQSGDRLWCAAALALGIAQIVFLVCNERRLRWLLAVLMCWFWGALALAIWATQPWTLWQPDVVAAAICCAANITSILRLPRPVP